MLATYLTVARRGIWGPSAAVHVPPAGLVPYGEVLVAVLHPQLPDPVALVWGSLADYALELVQHVLPLLRRELFVFQQSEGRVGSPPQ